MTALHLGPLAQHDHQVGLGLGLATVRRMKEAHGGTCGVRSTPGSGSTFWFDLPRWERAPAPAAARPPAAELE